MDGPEVDDVDRKDFIPLIPDEQTKNSLDDSVVLVERSGICCVFSFPKWNGDIKIPFAKLCIKSNPSQERNEIKI